MSHALRGRIAAASMMLMLATGDPVRLSAQSWRLDTLPAPVRIYGDTVHADAPLADARLWSVDTSRFRRHERGYASRREPLRDQSPLMIALTVCLIVATSIYIVRAFKSIHDL
jgi:hypothetical protein